MAEITEDGIRKIIDDKFNIVFLSLENHLKNSHETSKENRTKLDAISIQVAKIEIASEERGKNIVSRLDKINGSLTDHEKEIRSLQSDGSQLFSKFSEVLVHYNDQKADSKIKQQQDIVLISDKKKVILAWIERVITWGLILLLLILQRTGIINIGNP